MLPRGRMRPYTPMPPEGGYAGASFFWGGLVRIDVVDAPLSMRLTFNAFGLKVGAREARVWPWASVCTSVGCGRAVRGLSVCRVICCVCACVHACMRACVCACV